MKGHENTVKLLNLRFKILQLLSAYLENKIETTKENTKNEKICKNADYSSCIRLLNKEENISILNDGVTYLINFILKNNSKANILETKLNGNLTIENLEEALIKLVNKLILSKY
jgi:hypothetical protein